MLHKCFLDSETSVYFPSTRRWVRRNIDWIFQLCVKNKLENNLNGVKFYYYSYVTMSTWWHVNLSEATLWVCSDGRTLVCGVRLNAPRQQLRLSVRQRDDVHWKHIPFPVAPTSISSLRPLRPLLHTSVVTSIHVNATPPICRGPVLRHILKRFVSSVVTEFAGCARMLFIKLGGRMPKKRELDFFVAECVGLVCLTSGNLSSSVTNRSAASGHRSNPQSR